VEKGNYHHVFHVVEFENENVAFSVTTCTEPQHSMYQCMYVPLARTSDELKKSLQINVATSTYLV